MSHPSWFAAAVFGLGVGSLALSWAFGKKSLALVPPAMAIVIAEAWLFVLAMRLRKQWGRNMFEVVSKLRFALLVVMIPVFVIFGFLFIPAAFLLAASFLRGR